MQIESPKYSFVKFDGPESMGSCCDGDQAFCIPVIEETDTYFQIKLTSLDYAEIQAAMAAPIAEFQLLLLRGAANTPGTIDANLLRNWTVTDNLTFERYRTGLYEITFLWRNAFKDIKTLLACSDCFQIAFVSTTAGITGEFSDEFSDEFDIDNAAGSYTLIALSNCFKRFCDSCFTTVLEYTNDDDYGDFNYCNITNPLNRVRLPFYLSQPKTIEDKAVYRKSNGAIKQTRSLLTKEYLAQTEHFSELIHDKIAVALAHDIVNVISDNYTGGISKNGEYAIEWTDNICTAPASFKALATPFSIRNNNCQECTAVPACDPVVVPAFTLPDAGQAVAYSEDVILTGSLPIVLSNIVKPSWMTVTIVDNTITFAGTPADLATGSTVSFDVDNACGHDSADKIIDVVIPPCIGVGITGSPALPDGTVSIPYSNSFPITGTAPFSLSGVTKPSWMTIAVVGSTIAFSGTPDVEGTGITVEFDIDNCGSDTINFSDTIDIVELPSLAEISNSTGAGTYIQTAQVGSHVVAGNRFEAIVYSHVVSYIALLGDTPADVAIGLRDAINATSEASWDSASSAPASGTTGFPPVATASTDTITITLDAGHSFAFNAYVS